MEKNESLYIEQWRKLVSAKGACNLEFENGIEVEVLDGVFNPSNDITFSTQSLILNLPDLHDKKVLDIGCGTGVLSMFAAKHGATKVLGVDNCPLALLCANSNIKKNSLNTIVEIRDSSLFDNVSEKFDVVLANLPIFYESQANLIDRFFSQLPLHCNDGATVFFTGASFGRWDKIEQKINKYNLSSSPPCFEVLEYLEFGVMWYVGIIRFGSINY